MHCCCMQARAPGASQLGVRPPLGRPQLCCWWLPVPPQLRLPTGPLPSPPPPHPAGTRTAGPAVGSSSRRQLLILRHARLLSLKIYAAHTHATVQCGLLLWNGRLMGRWWSWCCAIREVKAGLCLHPPSLSISSLLLKCSLLWSQITYREEFVQKLWIWLGVELNQKQRTGIVSRTSWFMSLPFEYCSIGPSLLSLSALKSILHG